MPIPTGPVPDLLNRAARQFPDNPAISFSAGHDSYADLAAEVDRVAAGLQKIGVKRGTKVGLFLPNTPTFIVYYFAILKAGGTVVNFNPLYTLEELTFQAKDSETEIMVTHDLAALFCKIEDADAAAASSRAPSSCPSPPLLPPIKSVLFRVFKRRDIAPVSSSPRRAEDHQRRGVIGDHRADEARRDRSGRGRRRAAVHRRHHRHAKGRDADAREPRPPTRRRSERGRSTWSPARKSFSVRCRSFTSSP